MNNQPFEFKSDRIQALLTAVKDVAPSGHPRPISKERATKAHRELFDRYLSDLRLAKQQAEEWWDGRITVLMECTRVDRNQVVKEYKAKNPVEPVNFTRVIGAIRRFWLECTTLNNKVKASERVPPEQFILGWLMDGTHDDLAGFLSGLTYWPIGLDQEGNWV